MDYSSSGPPDRQSNTEVSSSTSPHNNTRLQQPTDYRTHHNLGPQQEAISYQSPFPHQQDDKGFEVTPVYASQRAEQQYVDSWVALPENAFFDARPQAKARVVATLVDEDTQPVTMVRAPELPHEVANAFADVPIPYDERPRPPVSQKFPSDSKAFGSGVRDVSGIQETPPPLPSESSSRGRRAFKNFLKKRTKVGRKSLPSPGSSRKASLASAIESEENYELSDVSERGRRTVSKSPAPRNRTRSLDDPGRIRNPNIAKKFSRLLKVYNNDVSNDDRVYL